MRRACVLLFALSWIGLCGATPAAADPQCDTNADRLCDRTACTTENNLPANCRQRNAGCNCEAPKAIVFSACAGGTPPAPSLTIFRGEEVAFVLDGNCTQVNIAGAGPIGSFSLGMDDAVNILFPALGTYPYSVNGGPNSGSVQVLAPAGAPVPAAKNPAVAALAAILAGGAAWSAKRRGLGLRAR